MPVIHCGWGKVMGRTICGRRNVHETLLEEAVTCTTCLNILIVDADHERARHFEAATKLLAEIE